MELLSELRTLAALFDDPDETVSECIDRRIHELGREAVRGLDILRREEGNPEQKARIADRQRRYTREFRLEDLERVARNSHTAGFSLSEAGFLISSLVDFELTPEGFDSMVLECAAEIRSEVSDLHTATENVEIFNHIFFHRLGFKVCDEDMAEDGFARLPEVFVGRRGNPIAIAYIYFLLAEEAGLPLAPVTVGSAFVPAYIERGSELFYMDLNFEGAIVPVRELDRAGEHTLRSRAILPVILLESLQFRAVNSHRRAESGVIENALDLFGPERFLTVSDEDDESGV